MYRRQSSKTASLALNSSFVTLNRRTGEHPSAHEMSDDKQPSNMKTALVLLSIAAVFFVAVFVKRTWFS